VNALLNHSPTGLCSLAALLLAMACGGDATGRVTIGFESESVGDKSARLEVSLIRSCELDDPTSAPVGPIDRWTIRRGESLPRIGELAAGTYALHARAVSADCDVIAAGCKAFRVRDGRSLNIDLVLASTADVPLCDAIETCADGACVIVAEEDAGDDAEVLPPTCANEALDDGETDVDCGGNCAPCPDSAGCASDADCASRWCDGDACADTTACDDLVDPAFCDGFEAPTLDETWTVPSVGVDPPVQGSTEVLRGRYAAFASTAGNESRAYVEGELSRTLDGGTVYARAHFFVPSTMTVAHFDLLSLYNSKPKADPDSGSMTVFAIGGTNLRVWIARQSMSVSGLTNALPKDEWFCVRLTFGYGVSSDVTMFVNDTEVVTAAGIDTTVPGGYTKVLTPVPFTNNTQGAVQVYVDEVAVSDSPIPCSL
jgi:hypothetical protein